ncbi:MAG TPA: NeuD/PglB/VioB family sugar acetyltransferase [Thermoanaerobaculia bacterium]|nr:NeuD/PglB/VioB family sugar acetyltransferase [Thermoanaerobaculia bacterium]
MQRILIIGRGAQAAIVADILGSAVAAMVEDHEPFPAHDAVIVAIGDNRARRAISERIAHEAFATAIHSFTSIAGSAVVGDGTMICAGAIVAPRASIGRGVLLNTKASVDHDSAIGDFAHIAPGATIGGRCRIGEETVIGPGATVVSGVTIGARVVVGAGAVVMRDLPDDVVAWGVPARLRT